VSIKKEEKDNAGNAEIAKGRSEMRIVVAAVIERSDRRLLIGQRRKEDTSPLKWEFPGGKARDGEAPEAALARELNEELGATMKRSVAIGSVVHKYADTPEQLKILFYAVEIRELEVVPHTFEKIAWVLPRELGQYDFLAANTELIANLATGRIKPAEILARSGSPAR
jgi:8-oxo-dGTP diphosphatase